ncbi:outer membrane lipase/esterase [Brevundimonas nasdae]|uniref:autotransporter domain-containing protein n=1 Tax=Brevundimonas nasdae TaxID=172043 RepID=UPI0019148EBC|nr:autotransporter domain-containing protein [Brevundimonas nasdae]MBK6024015.1 autotransporter domain-containing protein [Brevundimonas nasdae]MDQ0450670.1 outer membrane lipase/esterase [Brevundimonas nasdae]
MSRFLTGGAVAALALAACAFAGSASAQTYSRLVVFGDSLSDNGNLYLISSGTQPPSPPYYQGRFSSGQVWTERLGFNAANFNGSVTGSINYAFGGSRTDASAGVPFGMLNQLARYTAAGGKFGATDLVTVLGGANDIFQALPAAGASASPVAAMTPVATGAAANVNSLVNSVAGAGAGTILVSNLPKLSITPQFRGTPAAPLADYSATTFNTALQTGLNAVAAARPGSNIIMMDLFKIGDTITANPGQFGVSNVTAACFNGVSVCADPSSYFYFDGVHPTATGHILIAKLATDYLYYADIGSQSTLQGETTYRHREEALEAASEALSGREAWSQGVSITTSANYNNTKTDARGSVRSSTSDGWGGRIALEAGPSASWRFGMAGSAQKADVDSDAFKFSVESFGLDLYGGWRADNVFVNAAVGVARDNINDIKRTTSLAPIVHTGDTRAVSTGARLQGGMWFDMGGFALSPRAALAYVASDVDGYYEQGVAAQYQYGDRTVKALTGEVSLRAEAEMGGFGLFAEGGYRDALDDSSDPVRVGIFNNPTQVLSREIDDPFGGQFLASAGVEGLVGPVKVTVGYRGRFGDHADSHTGGIQLRLPL